MFEGNVCRICFQLTPAYPICIIITTSYLHYFSILQMQKPILMYLLSIDTSLSKLHNSSYQVLALFQYLTNAETNFDRTRGVINTVRL
jgi:hypothetical protein